jgi:multidrug efflux pump subunit AcrB
MNAQEEQKGIIAWFASNHVAANLLMLLLIISGLYSIFTITKKAMPDIDLPIIQIRVPFPGASPADVESGIVLQVEQAVDDVDGITRISSIATEGMASINLEIDEDYQINEVLNDIKVRVDSILTFPLNSEPPTVSRTQVRNDALRVEVYGDIDPVTQKELAQEIREELLTLPDVTTINISGARPYEISIEVSQDVLLKYGLNLDQIANKIRMSSLDLPAGTLETEGGEIVVRTQSLAYDFFDFEKIILITNQDGTLLTLGNVATIKDGFEDTESYARFDGKPTISLNVQTTSNQNLLAVTDAVKKYIAERQQTLPTGVNLDIWADSSYYLRDRLDLMTRNMLQGGILVFIILALFLELRLAFWVMLGIPISFLGAFATMPLVDLELNMLSLFGFIMVLGIVVDDAIIIGESSHHYIKKYGPGLNSVVHGALKVATPATFGVLTTIMAFIPLLMISGFASAFTYSIGAVVILCLVFSLLESKLILPAHLAHMSSKESSGLLSRIQNYCNNNLNRFVRNIYLPWNRKCIENRYITLGSFIGILIIAMGLVTGGFVRTVFLPEITSDFIQANITMVEGSPEQQMRNTLQKIEAAALSMNGKFEFLDSETDEISTDVMQHVIIISNSVSSATAAIEMNRDVPSQLDTDILTNYLIDYVGDMPGLKNISFSSGFQIGGSPIAFQLVSKNPAQLTAAANELEEQLRTYSGLINIKNEAVNNKDELKLSLKPRAEVMGLSLMDVSNQVRYAFYGSQAQRMQRGNDEVRVMVRYPEEERISIGDLENLYIKTSQGDLVPFETIAEFTQQPAYSRINRIEGERSVSVSADIIESQVEPGQIVEQLESEYFPMLFQRYPEVGFRADGGTQEQRDIIQDMIRGLILAIFGIYALLAIPLRSYTQPLIIMGVIPFGVVGAIFGHWLLGIPLNFLSFLGIIALSGVVVNDSIVVVDFINTAKSEGKDLLSAVQYAGAARFRAILLTSLTTFFGLIPILSETSMQAQFLIPMATSLAFGIVFATIITLIFIPCLYVILEDIKGESFDLNTSVLTLNDEFVQEQQA